MIKALFFVLAILSTALAIAPLHLATQDKIDDEYIVVLKDHAVAETTQSTINLALSIDPSAQVLFNYSYVFHGFSIKTTSPDALKAILFSDDVAFVEENQMMHAIWEEVSEEEEAEQACYTQSSSPSWGLVRVTRGGTSTTGSSTYENSRGSGTYNYIVDTGIRITHNDFGGRAVYGWSAFSGNPSDGNGHGTHVAGTVGGTTYGFAKQGTLVAVKVLSDSGSGSNAGVIGGIDWSASNCAGRRCTMNLSLGGGKSSATENAVDSAWNKGVFVAVAAGNSNANACNSSPSGSRVVEVVGSTTSSNARSSFSNWGSCLRIFAPGSSITSAWYTSNSASNTISGTSMACPHVAGVAALILGQSSASPSSVRSTMHGWSTSNGVSNPGTGSPNLLLKSSC